MRFDNPTPLRIGMVGEFFGKRYRVAGRVVLGMEEKGRTFFWNEFNLVNTENESLDLVFEITEDGAEWRLFTLFDPDPPLTAAVAATKKAGDHLRLSGTNVVITTVSESRIYHIEGVPAEGEDLGDVAQYFNARGGNTKMVVSWTGNQVECYRGMDVPAVTIKSAFKLQCDLPGSSLFLRAVSTQRRPFRFRALVVLLAVILLPLVIAYIIAGADQPVPPVLKTSAPPSPLKVGASGNLNGHLWQVREHSIAEMDQVGRISEQHEYQIVDDYANKALLVYGLVPGQQDWYLFIPVESSAALSPADAAMKATGQIVNIDGSDARIKQLFQRVLHLTETPESSDNTTRTATFGFTAQSNDSLLLAEWDQNHIAFYRGKLLPAKEVAVGFHL